MMPKQPLFQCWREGRRAPHVCPSIVRAASKMGHVRLGTIPKSQPWRAVVSAVVQGGGAGGGAYGEDSSSSAQETPASHAVMEVAARTQDAAHAGLERPVNDSSLQQTFHLLTQVALASRSPDWRERLARLGIAIRENGTVFDLTSGLQAALDERFLRSGAVTDISEMAQRSAGEALCRLTADR
ncbi:MAG: hypothetical protein JWM95_2787 [Gemmatimonadetes bacterium]|nr:hypothetical protein [Gemmatimonadota bacterium]